MLSCCACVVARWRTPIAATSAGSVPPATAASPAAASAAPIRPARRAAGRRRSGRTSGCARIHNLTVDVLSSQLALSLPGILCLTQQWLNENCTCPLGRRSCFAGQDLWLCTAGKHSHETCAALCLSTAGCAAYDIEGSGNNAECCLFKAGCVAPSPFVAENSYSYAVYIPYSLGEF